MAFACEGATVVLSSRTRSDLEETLALVQRAGSTGSIVVADATTADGAAAPVQAAIDKYGRLDVLVNNVGGRIAGDHDPFSGDVEVFHAELVLNLMSAWWATRAALPHMKENRYGRIINIGSGASRRSGSRAGYTAAKHGLVGLTRSLAASCARWGINVNCLCPGWTETHDWAELASREGTTIAEYLHSATSQNLQQRIVQPDEMGAMAVLLASDVGASAITGQVIAVDAGHKV
ncbi:3-hydroxybutyrate dehydrogenase [Sphaerimonospora thailandensis]|uniref:3-hydroxybutyrate dehydrogenase n=1 Tax=Sphaerimonospora thailandensis TaxID=795644 RepID=A0A8J3RB26_9ACTN|nr:3-hydroxybutyrate dehydrogenase [Sphaerimonospora thailandensis]